MKKYNEQLRLGVANDNMTSPQEPPDTDTTQTIQRLVMRSVSSVCLCACLL